MRILHYLGCGKKLKYDSGEIILLDRNETTEINSNQEENNIIFDGELRLENGSFTIEGDWIDQIFEEGPECPETNGSDNEHISNTPNE